MHSQTDFTIEAANLWRLARNFEKSVVLKNKVSFPKPIVATPDVLIEPFVPGEKLEDFIRDPERDVFKAKEIAEIGLDSFLVYFIH